MVVQDLLWQKLSYLFHQYEPKGSNREQYEPTEPSHNSSTNSLEYFTRAALKAQGEWVGAIAALEQLLTTTIDFKTDQCQGIIISSPAPVISSPSLLTHLQTVILTPNELPTLALMPSSTNALPRQISVTLTSWELPLFPHDPLIQEQFCLVFTSNFALLILLGEDQNGLPAFQFSFAPELITKVWVSLLTHLFLAKPQQLQKLDRLVSQFTPPTPDYRTVTQFSRKLLQYLPELPTSEVKKPRSIETISTEAKVSTKNTVSLNQSEAIFKTNNAPEVELLQALTHEIRTPLTTIRTLTRLLLKKRCHLSADIIKRLELIDQECSEQIARMELIFRAAELETKPRQPENVQLIPISLEQLLQQSIPRWQKQAQRRNVILDVILPNKLPQVVSDPAMLDQVLTGLMENFTRGLPTGGQIRVQVSTAGNQLKLQLLPQSNYQSNPFKSLGHLLMFQPETGSLSLNMNVTKNLFNALGGKLIVRQKAQQGDVLTIFLPLTNTSIKNK